MTKAKKAAPPDQPARDRIKEDLATTFLVEAGAGSGKTRSLVERMIALLASGRAEIDSLAAVTFTRKAAAELRERFQVALEKARLDERDPGVRARLDAALTGLERSFIGTIHSFCARLLRERPVEAGLDPDFRELEEHEDRVLLEACWDEYQARARLENEAALRGLDEAGLEPAELESAFMALSGFPEVEPVAGRADPPDLTEARRALERLLLTARALVPEDRPEKGRDGLQRVLIRCFRRQRNIGFADPRRLMETLELFDKKLGVTKNRWAAKEDAEKMLAAAESFQAGQALPAVRAWREYRHGKALAYLRPALAFAAERRRAEARLNFQDQLLLAAKLLRENPEVRGYFRKRFHPILVDEFQDTDPIQAEILFLLAGRRDDGERDWTAFRPEPGSLFLVGDPKQSIYRFRRADIDIYNKVKELIVASGGEVLELGANFRSLGVIADWVNPLFDPGRGGLFPAAADAYQAGFMRLDSVLGPGAAPVRGVRRATAPAVPRHAKDGIVESDSRRVADFIAWALETKLALDDGPGRTRPAEPGDFLVLFRYKDRMSDYARRLEERKIPYEISGSDAFSASPEIGEVLNLMRALDDPDDPVAAVAVLRGLFFGLSDQELVEHRAAGGSFRYADPASRKEGLERVRKAFGVLAGWRELVGTLPPSAALEAVLQRSGLLNHLATAEMGSSRTGNVLKLVEVLRGRESEDMTSFAAAVAFMGEWVGAQPVEEMSLTPGRRNAVRLMNLHKAKGLEAPVVWLANPVGVRDFEPERHVVRKEGPPQGHFRFAKPFGPSTRTISQSPGWEECAAEEKAYEEAEENRLMYVAATRPRNLLVISAYAGDLGARKAWGPLEAGLEGLPELAEGAPPGPAPGTTKGARRRKPAIVQPGEALKARVALQRKMARAATAGELHESVTSVARRDRDLPEWAKGGLGRFGAEVHAMLKALGEAGPEAGRPRRADGAGEEALGRMARDILVTAGRSPTEAPALAGHVAGIVRSAFWRRAAAAERRLFEVPFAVRVEPGQAGYEDLAPRAGAVPFAGGRPVVPAPGAPVYLTGAIDLVFFEGDGWVIADYKTDRLPAALAGAPEAERDKALGRLVEHYAPQVRLYTRFWEKVTGEKVKESGLYFTALERWVPVGRS
ncbi:MAG TPA: UvrD-helicase domain-containing protein [Candidatus Aminicenantes bacterium]|nr:UvrD-helicase domain-containing protein [Candidatus Aminicenantes bacterium]